MKCPHCGQQLQVIDVDFEGLDVMGCYECYWIKTNQEDDLEYFKLRG